MSNYIKIKFDFDNVKVDSNIGNNDDIKRILSFYLENNIGKSNDDVEFNKKEEYFVNFNIKNKNIDIKSNVGNNDLACGIVLMAIDNLE